MSSYAHYAEIKLKNPFPLGEFVTPMGFLGFLRKHGLSLSNVGLEKFDQEGWVRPVFRMHTERLKSGQALLTDTVSLKENYENGLIKFTKDDDYVPWRTFESDPNERTLIFYHPFQLLQVQSALKRKTVSFINHDSWTQDDLYKIVDHVKSGPTLGDVLLNSRFDQADAIGFLMLLEEPYYFYLHRGVTIHAMIRQDEYSKSREAWKQPQVCKELLASSIFSVDDVRKMREYFEGQARFVDPLKRWKHLLGIIDPSMIDELEGPAQLAQFYYKIIRVLDAFIYDLTGERVENVVDYTDHGARTEIIKQFTNFTPLQLIVLVEGKTELNIIKKIFKNIDLRFDNIGLEVVDCGGISQMTPSNPIINLAITHHAAIYLIADCENKIKKQIQDIQNSPNMGTIQFGYRLWKNSFEDVHFDDQEMFNYINNNLPNGRSLRWEDVEAEHAKDKTTMFSAIASVYYGNYCASNNDANLKHKRSVLEDAIGSPKHDLSLKLIEPKLTLNPESRTTNIEIEKEVLNILGFLSNQPNPRQPKLTLPQKSDCT